MFPINNVTNNVTNKGVAWSVLEAPKVPYLWMLVNETSDHVSFYLVDAEIVSIDAFNKSPPKRGLVVGITFVKVFPS